MFNIEITNIIVCQPTIHVFICQFENYCTYICVMFNASHQKILILKHNETGTAIIDKRIYMVYLIIIMKYIVYSLIKLIITLHNTL